MEEVISVGALDEDLSILDMTSGSDFTVINAPGENVKTLDVNGEVFHSSGTSQATTLISGYIALLKGYAFKNNKKSYK